MEDTKTLHFGAGEKGKFVAIDLLRQLEVPQEVIDSIGNGLNIGGLNIGFPEKVIGLPADTTELRIQAPGMDAIIVNCVNDVPERTPEEEAQVLANRSGQTEEVAEEAVNEATE